MIQKETNKRKEKRKKKKKEKKGKGQKGRRLLIKVPKDSIFDVRSKLYFTIKPNPKFRFILVSLA